MNKLIAAAICLVMVAGHAAARSVPALNFDHADPVIGDAASSFPLGSVWDLHPEATRGYGFEILEPVNVTELGVYDDAGDGIQGAYRVGVWQGWLFDDGPLLISGTVEGGQSADLVGSWRLVDTPDTVLAPGTYRIGIIPEANITWAEDRDFCEQFNICDSLNVPAEPPVPEVDQYYWLTEPPNTAAGRRATSNDPRFDLFPMFETFVPAFSTGRGFQAPDSRLLVSGGYAGATIFVEIPEPGAVTLLVAALAASGARRYRV